MRITSSFVMPLPLVLLLSASAAPALAISRSTSDRPDDVAGNQIHFLYVVPSDGADRGLDTNGTLETSIAAFLNWFQAASGGLQLRIDRFQGAADITFYRLGRTDAQMSSFGIFLRDEIEDDLNRAGFNSANKMYAVYYDGKSTAACGSGFWPPTLPGNVVAQFLKGEVPGFVPCASNPFATSPFNPGYWEFGMLHEIFHGLGAVATCAPHHTRAGHVSDDPRDLMYAGDQPWRPSILDINHDDYFGHDRTGCLDVADSPFLVRGSTGGCTPSVTTLCIDDQSGDRRFRVDVSFRSANGPGQGKAISLAAQGVNRGGLFWFFSQDNPELLIKVLNGCSLNDRFWVFSSAGTDVEMDVTVTDTISGRTKTYHNDLGVSAAPVQDTSAFPCH